MNTTELDKNKDDTVADKSASQKWRRPRYDVSESDEAFDLQVALPGVQREAVELSVEGDQLTLIARRTAAPAKDWRPLRRELPAGDFRLNIHLNVAIEADRISARVADGILDLSLPKADAVKPRKIQVS